VPQALTQKPEETLPGLKEPQPLKKFPEGMEMILPGFHRRLATDKRQELVMRQFARVLFSDLSACTSGNQACLSTWQTGRRVPQT